MTVDRSRREGGPLGHSVVFVNNSRESFTPTVSGAIATCLWELSRAAGRLGRGPTVVTHSIDAEPYGWERTIFVPDAKAPRGRMLPKAQRAWRRLSGWARPGQRAYARRVLRELRSLDVDLVVCNNDPEISVFLSRRLPDVVVVHWFHNLELVSDRFRRRFLAADRLVSVAVSAYLARAVEGTYGLQPLSVGVACPGVDSVTFAPAGMPEPEEAAHPTLPVITFLGRICVEKAPETFLRAALVLARTRQDFVVQVIGDTNWGRSEPSRFRDLVTGLMDGLVDAGVEVRWHGHVERARVPGLLRASAIQVVPSRWDEPFGLVVLEGMASGVPPVVSAAGGLPEVVGEAGLLFPRDDVDALARRLATLLDDPLLRETLGAAARRRAAAFGWERTWEALVNR